MKLVLKARPVLKDPPDRKAQLVRLVRLEQPVRRGPPVLKVRREFRECPALNSSQEHP